MHISDYQYSAPSLTLDDIVCEDIWRCILKGCASANYDQSKAFLFAGEMGSGKTTMARAFAGTAFQKSQCPMYWIPVVDMIGEDNDTALAHINRFFEEMTEMFADFSEGISKKSYFVFFEDLEDLQTPTLQNCFFRNLETLLHQPDFSVIVAATYPTRAAEVPRIFRKNMYICALAFPDVTMRQKYFQLHSYSERKSKLFLDLTTGFGFGEMAELDDLLSMYQQSDDTALDGEEIETIFHLVKQAVAQSRYVEPKATPTFAYMPPMVGAEPLQDKEEQIADMDLAATAAELSSQIVEQQVTAKDIDDAENMVLPGNPF